MGWFSNLIKKPLRSSKYAMTMGGSEPIFSQFGTNIYASDVVQQALKCIVDEMKKLNPTHVRYNGSDPVPIRDSSIQSVLDDPNELMTTSEFLEKTCWLLLLNYNVFIIPSYRTWKDVNTGQERRYYEKLYPILPKEVDFLEDDTGKLFVRFYFPKGENTTLAYDDVIHIKYNYSVNDFMGGNRTGQPETEAILKTLELNHTLLEGVAKAMKAGYSVNAVVKYAGTIDEEKTIKAVKELERKLDNNENGFLPLDMKADFTPIPRSIQLVDEATLKFVDEKILRNFGVPLPILTGDYNKEQYAAFYQKTLEPLILSISQAFTKKMFTPREKAYGNKIKLYPKDLIFMTVSQTLEMIRELGPTGTLYENEKRTALGLAPLPELEGKRLMSLNWIDADMATEYQMSKTSDGGSNEDHN